MCYPFGNEESSAKMVRRVTEVVKAPSANEFLEHWNGLSVRADTNFGAYVGIPLFAGYMSRIEVA